MNFHVFVLLSTLLYYLLLRSYKNSVIADKSKIRKKSNLIYLLFLPILMYIFYYLFLKREQKSINITEQMSSEDLMSRPYPDTMSSI